MKRFTTVASALPEPAPAQHLMNQDLTPMRPEACIDMVREHHTRPASFLQESGLDLGGDISR
ncbi:hypothetical protein ACWEVD_01715 [Nocardia thailandica]